MNLIHKLMLIEEQIRNMNLIHELMGSAAEIESFPNYTSVCI